MTTDPVVFDIHEGVATIRLNRPEVLNALSTPLVSALREILAELRQSDEVRVLVLTGNGRAFCAGADLTDPMMSLHVDREERGHSFRAVMDTQMNGFLRELYSFDRPKIAAVNGPAVGGGLGLALIMDMVIAARSAYFMQVFAPTLNLVPDLGCSWLLARQLGRARAVGMSMTGDRIDAETAEQWGLIWKCVDDEKLTETVGEIARKLAEGPPRALAATPPLIDAAMTRGFSDHLDLERDNQAPLVETLDFEEAVQAFKEKRKPVFSGR